MTLETGLPPLQATHNDLAIWVRAALEQAIAGRGKLTEPVLALPGMSGKKYRLFINNLIGSLPEPRYLEIGVWKGSTLCSAIFGNRVNALAIDNWSEFGGPAFEFLTNLAKFKGEAVVSFLECDFRAVNFNTVGKFNVFLFDGPHAQTDQRDGIILALPALDDRFVLIVDDWNWNTVRAGTRAAIAQAGLAVDFGIEVRTTNDNSHPPISGERSDWHNGYFIAACSKRR